MVIAAEVSLEHKEQGIKMTIKIIIYFTLFGFFNSVCRADIMPCQGQAIKNKNVSVSDLISGANTIALVRVTSFTENSLQNLYSGYYQFQSISTVLGLFNPDYKLWGGMTYKEIPQQYMDLTQTHNAIDFENLYGVGITEIRHDTNGSCSLMPRFKIGWNYLIITGVNSTLAFEPINSPNLDQWFKKVVITSNIIKDKNWSRK